MNALDRIPEASTTGPQPGRILFADLPADAPLAMPAQCLRRSPAAVRSAKASSASLKLGGLIVATAGLTGLALAPVYGVLSADTIGPLDLLILVLVAMLFAWSAFSFLSAFAGFVVGLGHAPCSLGIQTNGPLPGLRLRTAVLMPVYNEAPAPVFARLQAICESLDATGAGAAFDVFVLSDTTDPDVRASEYALFRRLKWRLGAPQRIFYRHRPQNVARKAGNIAEWVRRFGGAYAHMVVLDADSLMEGETLVRLAATMEREADIGLIQTAPAIVNRHTLFARAEQFASRLYGPMLARGVAWWSGSEGNYWGHNAIIRVAAFAAHSGLPRLRGRKPFGGHIMSHDFVEAALLRRAGWRVHMASELGGSYEESPPTLAALLARDRRWCQGNLQHVPIIGARGLHWISRFHLLRGISAYLVAPLWLSLLISAVVLPLHPQWGVQAGAPLRGAADAFDVAAVGVVFGVGLAFLLAPKILACLEMLRTGHGAGFGGAGLAAANVAIESLLSMLVAPLIMVSHTCTLAAVVAGRDSGWVAQAREETGLNLRQTLRLHAADTLLGLTLTVTSLMSSMRPLLWMTPVIAGLALAIPLASAGASGQLGRTARRAGVLLVPEEKRPPRILARANALTEGWVGSGDGSAEAAFSALQREPGASSLA